MEGLKTEFTIGENIKPMISEFSVIKDGVLICHVPDYLGKPMAEVITRLLNENSKYKIDSEIVKL